MDSKRSSLALHVSDPAISRRTALLRLAGTGGGVCLSAAMGRDLVQAQGTPAPRAEEGEAPNLFVLTGTETVIRYGASADTRPQWMTYEGPYGNRMFIEAEIHAEESALGRLITVYLGAFPDQGDLWLTLLLPRFNPMTIADAPIPFATLAILTWVISTIAGPPSTGALEGYTAIRLEGTAQVGESPSTE